MQFAYAIPERFVVVEPPPGWTEPAPARPKSDPRRDAWIATAIVGGVVSAVVLALALLAGGTSVVGGLLGWGVVGFAVASPVVLVVCLVILAAKAAAGSAMRERDAERAER